MAKHTRISAFLAALLCLVLGAALPLPAAAAAGERELPMAVSAALAGARQTAVQAQVFREWVTNIYRDTLPMDAPQVLGTVPDYAQSPQTCLAAALALAVQRPLWEDDGTASAVESAALADLNGDGVPELILQSGLFQWGSWLEVFDLSGGQLQSLAWFSGYYPQTVLRTRDAAGRQGVCITATLSKTDVFDALAVFLYHEPAAGWQLQMASWGGTARPQAAASLADVLAGEAAPVTTVLADGIPVIDPGNRQLQRLLTQPVQAYGSPGAQVWPKDTFAACADNQAGWYIGQYASLAQPQAAGALAQELLAEWNSLTPVQPADAGTVFDVLMRDWVSPTNPLEPDAAG